MLFSLLYWFIIFHHCITGSLGREVDCTIPSNHGIIFNIDNRYMQCLGIELSDMQVQDELFTANRCLYFDPNFMEHRVVAQLHKDDHFMWTVCNVKGERETKFCQYQGRLYVPKAKLGGMTGQGDDESCDVMLQTLNIDQLNQLTADPQSSDLLAQKMDIDYPDIEEVPAPDDYNNNEADEDDYYDDVIVPPNPHVFACRHGDYEGVFYNETGFPTHCVVNFEHREKGKCLSIVDLFLAIYSISTKAFPSNLADDMTFKYKNQILQNRAELYYSGKGKQYFNGTNKNYWNQKQVTYAFGRLFVEGVKLFDKIYTEPFVIQLPLVGVIGAKVFCDTALKAYPMKNKDLFKLVQPGTMRREFKPPAAINLVYYKIMPGDAIESPSACYFPPNHLDLYQQTVKGNCMKFETALALLVRKNNANEDSTGKKQNLLAGILKMHVKSLAPYDNQPGKTQFLFDRMRANDVKRSFRDMLIELDIALGYQDSVNKMEFNIPMGDPYDTNPTSPLFISPHTLCTAVVELIPFSKNTVIQNLQPC